MGSEASPQGVLAIVAGLGLLFAFSAAYFWYESADLKLQLNESDRQRDSALQQTHELQAQLQEKGTELRGAADALTKTQLELTRTQTTLNQTSFELHRTQEQLRETATAAARQQLAIQSLQQNLSIMNRTIGEAIQWFRSNAQLPPASDLPSDQVRRWAEAFNRSLYQNCRDGTTGRFRLACVPLMMEQKLSFTYRLDPQNKFPAVSQIYYKNGGDCKDYSVFLKAALGSLKQADPGLELEAWETQRGTRYDFYSETTSKGIEGWYYPDAVGKPLGRLRDLNPDVICYTTRFEKDVFEGHCIVALTPAKITRDDDLKVLEGAVSFEPQNGEYMGEVGDANGRRLCVNGQQNCEQEINRISLVISDEDLYAFQGGQWQSYHDFQNQIDIIGAEIGQRLNFTG